MGRGLGAVVDAELVQDGVHVIVDGPLTDEERPRDCGIAVADGNELENFAFPPRQMVWIRVRICATTDMFCTSQGGQPLLRTIDGSDCIELLESEQRSLHGGDVAAQLCDGRVVGGATPSPRIGRRLPVSGHF
jgi:hypothetical protein